MNILKEIAQHYLQKIIISDCYFSQNPCREQSLLFPKFLEKVQKAINFFNVDYPDVQVVLVETYRSNTLQKIYFNNGASKIRTNGMHHYGIACDCAFSINGKFTYNGDYERLRNYFLSVGLNLLGLWDMGHVQGISVTLQSDLRIEVDNAIREFQKINGLIVDGIVGKKTITKAKGLFL